MRHFRHVAVLGIFMAFFMVDQTIGETRPIRPDKEIVQLLKQTSTRDTEAREKANRALASMKKQRLENGLAYTLLTQSQTRPAALWYIRENFLHPSILPYVYQAIHATPGVIKPAIGVMERIPDKRSIPILIKYLDKAPLDHGFLHADGHAERYTRDYLADMAELLHKLTDGKVGTDSMKRHPHHNAAFSAKYRAKRMKMVKEWRAWWSANQKTVLPGWKDPGKIVFTSKASVMKWCEKKKKLFSKDINTDVQNKWNARVRLLVNRAKDYGKNVRDFQLSGVDVSELRGPQFTPQAFETLLAFEGVDDQKRPLSDKEWVAHRMTIVSLGGNEDAHAKRMFLLWAWKQGLLNDVPAVVYVLKESAIPQHEEIILALWKTIEDDDLRMGLVASLGRIRTRKGTELLLEVAFSAPYDDLDLKDIKAYGASRCASKASSIVEGIASRSDPALAEQVYKGVKPHLQSKHDGHFWASVRILSALPCREQVVNSLKSTADSLPEDSKRRENLLRLLKMAKTKE
jgi:hypothetical protein